MKRILDLPAYLNALASLSSAIKCGAESHLFLEAPFSREGLVSYVINSRILSRPMLVEVALPSCYTVFSGQIRYPVMYMMDSIKHIELFDNTNILSAHAESFSKRKVKEVITVGIDFITEEGRQEEYRLGYHTPVESNDKTFGLIGGNADLFLQFIEEEVKPLIREAYNTDTQNQTLAGHLYGGLLTLYALITHPGLFNNYIASSPIISWGNKAICDHETNYSKTNRALSKNVYVSMGSMEFMFQDVTKNAEYFVEKLHGRNYKGLRLLREVHQDENHDSAIVRSYANGARFVYNE